MDNLRKHFRVGGEGLEVDISDDVGFCTARVRDVSRFGICLSDMPRELHVKDGEFLLVISGQGQRFRMNGRGKWHKTEGLEKVIGVELRDTPWAWTTFISSVEPTQDDVWAGENRMSI